MTDDELVKFIQTNEPLARARSKLRSWCGRIERTMTGKGPRNGPIMARRMEMQAVLDMVHTMLEHAEPPKDRHDPQYLMHYESWFLEAMQAVIVADLRYRNAHIYRDAKPDQLNEIAARRMNDDKSRGAAEDRDAAEKTVYAVLAILRKRGLLRDGF